MKDSSSSLALASDIHKNLSPKKYNQKQQSVFDLAHDNLYSKYI